MTGPFSSSGMQRTFTSNSLGNKRISPTSDQARIRCLLEEVEEWALHRGKQRRKKPGFNMKLHFFLCPETIKTKFSPAGSLEGEGFGRWSASTEKKYDNSSFSSHPTTFRFLVQMVQIMGCFYTTQEIMRTIIGTGHVCHIEMGTTAPEMPRHSPSWPHLQTDT